MEDMLKNITVSDFFDKSTDLWAVVGSDGYLKRVNPEWTKRFKWNKEELIGSPSLSFVHPADRGATMLALGELFQNNKDTHIENRCRDKDGKYYWLSWSAFCCPSRGVALILARDISHIKALTEDMRKSNRVLRIINASNRLLISATDETFFLGEICKSIIEDGGYRLAWIGLAEKNEGKWVKPVASAGFEEGYIEKIKVSWEDNKFGRGPTGTAIRTGKASIVKDILVNEEYAPWREEALRRGYASSIALPIKIDGIIGALNIYAAEPDAFGSEEVNLLSQIARDISFGISAIRTASGYKISEKKVAELSDLRRRLLDILSHQLRTPLTSINWNLEMILSGEIEQLSEGNRKLLEVTLGASNKLTKRLSIVLKVMDLEEGRLLTRSEEISLADVLSSVCEQYKKRSSLKKIKLRNETPQNMTPLVMGDSEKLRLVVEILIGNALDYTEEGGSVIVKLLTNGSNARFEITDNGIGIPPMESNNIFKIFFRASNAQTMQPDGFGLELFLAKNFINNMGGKISFERAKEKGTTFWFEMPILEKNS